jgi:MoaA/NifB/PqqE/SkfB family radical SAM enzyme
MRSLRILTDGVRQRLGAELAPRMLTYTVTFACNARCVMCDSWRKPPEDELTIAEIEHIFAQMPKLDVVRLTGGEPFVRKDLLEIGSLAIRHLRPIVLHVTTNGFLTDRIVEFAERRPQRPLLHLLVSIDGVAEEHDRIRGHRHAWEFAFRTLAALAPRQRELNLHLGVNQTIVDRRGLEQYARLRDRLAPLGIQNQAVIAYAESATYSLERAVDLAPADPGSYRTHGDLPRDELAATLAQMERDLGKLPIADRIAKRFYLRGIRRRLLEGVASDQPPCAALGAHIRLFPNGDVPTCQLNTLRAGNLRRQSFAEFRSDPLRRRQREWVRRCKGCWAECEVLPSAIYSGEIFRALLPERGAPESAVAATTVPAP